MNIKKLSIIFLAYSTIGFNATAYGQSVVKRIDSLMKAVNANGVFNGNVLVIESNKMIFKKSFGFADGGRLQPLNTEMLFEIGSIGKEFNATGILILQERKKLSLDDKLSMYLPSLPKWADSIELRHLINYTSGLPLSNTVTDADNMAEIESANTLKFKPGSNYLYSYSNILLQRKIIEKVSGKSYADFITDNIFRPLGMKDARIDLPLTNGSVAKSFRSDGVELGYSPSPQGFVRINISDLTKWVIGLKSGKLINHKSLYQLGLSFGEGESSIGLARFEKDSIVFHQHHGSNFNYEALITHDVKKARIIILQTNSQQFKVSAITNAISDILDGRSFTIPKRSIYLDLRELMVKDFDKGVRLYNDILQKGQEKYDLSFVAGDLVSTGKYLMRRQKDDNALAIFALVTMLDHLKPQDLSVAYQLSSEIYEKKGYIQLAILYLKQCLKFDAENKSASSRLQAIQ